ncbi:hypothetical protein JF50_25480 [Pseudoalteromonas luteoviolacea]|uniref:Uncharacterized protein n=1 Tax=Pseudoalteromonas luteoviolacea TaxID=43657 RepID=A0A0C1MEF5_9GAMM|nr:hypothetical protein [Pseudoalteromonas luteoviolacea]KID55154.1 hypothetical protein JF50_25480 [Pseudoalteromonas luteoviolacea]
MNELYSIFEFAPISVILFGLLLSWHVPTARWFLISYAIVEIIDLMILPISIQWNTHYYAFDIFMALVFILPIVYRREVALFLHSKTGNGYFRIVYERQSLSAQECGIILVMVLTCIVNFVTWIEVLSYKYDFIVNAPFKLYFRDNIILLLHIIMCGAILTYALKAQEREQEFLQNETTE